MCFYQVRWIFSHAIVSIPNLAKHVGISIDNGRHKCAKCHILPFEVGLEQAVDPIVDVVLTSEDEGAASFIFRVITLKLLVRADSEATSLTPTAYALRQSQPVLEASPSIVSRPETRLLQRTNFREHEFEIK